MLRLAFGLSFAGLYEREGLLRLDAAFLEFLRAADASSAERLAAARLAPAVLAREAESALILELAPHLERFLAQLFGVAEEALALARRHDELAPLYHMKRQFVQRRAAIKYKAPDVQDLDGPAVAADLARRFGLPGRTFTELEFAASVERWVGEEWAHEDDLELAMRYAAWALYTPAGRERHRGDVLFHLPAKVDPHRLLRHAVTSDETGTAVYRIAPGHLRRRDGFELTDPGTDLVGALDQVNYCIWCHNHGKDSCSRGLREKPTAAAPRPVAFRKSVFNVTLAGCPLEEKISEFQFAKSQGLPLAALAIIVVDNPLLAATGHRICNDCMKACF
ncbi:MAG: pyridine nucleotide-disulfide oxidoreductase, partial [Burkholderiales bacterium]|nr:pyridine nucleotide-disulfide oxidoreductase [Burkholderiales bacterium]